MLVPVLIVVALLAVAGLGWVLLRSPPAARARPATAPALPRAVATPAPPAAEAPAPQPAVPVLPRPAALPLCRAESLDASAQAPLLDALRRLPRPPRALDQLMSPQFLQTATSAELAAIVMGEPAVAARVVATVNSPFYGLKQSVTSLGQATTFLGLGTVRQLCLQYLLAESFKPRDADQQREFEVLWRASSTAAELVQQLAARLRLPEPGALATLLVLTFLGRQAAVALLPDTRALAGMDAHQRALHEQATLGLPAHELGLLLMRAWALPDDMARDARDIAAIGFDPALAVLAEREAALTLCAVCAQLGERAVRGTLDLATLELATDPAPDLAALRHRLAVPALQALPAEFRSPHLVRLLGRTG